MLRNESSFQVESKSTWFDHSRWPLLEHNFYGFFSSFFFSSFNFIIFDSLKKRKKMTGGRSPYFSRPFARWRSTYYPWPRHRNIERKVTFLMWFWKKNQKINSDLGKDLFLWTFFIQFFKDLLWDPPKKYQIMLRT